MRRPASALWVVLFAVAFGTNVPTPLLLVYRDTLDLAPTTLTGIFGIYALGLLPALLLAGPASDRLGRRPVVVPFVLLSAAASVVFLLAARSVPLLFAGRFLQGAVSGVVFSIGSAWMAELLPEPGIAARRAAAALGSGWALGPLSAGLLAEWAPAPTVVPYLLHLALMVTGVLALARVPETWAGKPGGPLFNLGVPAGARTAFCLAVLPAAVGVFTFPAVAITLLPLLLQPVMPGIAVAVTGLVAGVTMGTGVSSQRLQRRLPPTRAAAIGLALGAGGFGLSLVAFRLGVWQLLIPVALLLGAGYGLCLTSGLAMTERLAAREARGALTATFYACAYAGFGAPFLVSVAARSTGFTTPLGILTAALAVLALLVAAGPGERLVNDAAIQRAPASRIQEPVRRSSNL